jgi:hypothetical protein
MATKAVIRPVRQVLLLHFRLGGESLLLEHVVGARLEVFMALWAASVSTLVELHITDDHSRQ